MGGFSDSIHNRNPFGRAKKERGREGIGTVNSKGGDAYEQRR